MGEKEEVDFSCLNETLRKAFAHIREEFDEHLDAINENTNEIQANYEFLCKLDAKIEKLNERLDELQILLKPGHAKEKALIRPLTKHEKEVFLVLYESLENFVTYLEIGRSLGLTESLVSEYVKGLIAKGIPIEKRYVNNKAYIKLDTDFRNLQTREDIIGINKPVFDKLF